MSEEGISSSNTKRNTLRKLLTCHRFHVIIVILVIVDCICVASELLVLELEHLIIPKNNACENKSLVAFNNSTLKNTNHIFKIHKEKQTGNYNLHMTFYVVENILKYTSTSILGLFTVEVILKIILVPNVFKRKLELIDAVIVTCTFGLNLALIILHNEADALSGLFAILR